MSSKVKQFMERQRESRKAVDTPGLRAKVALAEQIPLSSWTYRTSTGDRPFDLVLQASLQCADIGLQTHARELMIKYYSAEVKKKDPLAVAQAESISDYHSDLRAKLV